MGTEPEAALSARCRQRGQGMMEYIIIVALLGVASIGTYSLFGKTVRNQTAAIAAALGGDATSAKRANGNANFAGGDAKLEAEAERNLADFTKGTEKK
jgi:Flp pilus assembly pilin Flp